MTDRDSEELYTASGAVFVAGGNGTDKADV